MKLADRARNPRVWLLPVLALAVLIGTRLTSAQTAASPVTHGNVGVGTYATVAQFKDLHVAAGEDVLLHKTLAEGLADFDLSGGGQWKVLDSVVQQSGTETPAPSPLRAPMTNQNAYQ